MNMCGNTFNNLLGMEMDSKLIVKYLQLINFNERVLLRTILNNMWKWMYKWV